MAATGNDDMIRENWRENIRYMEENFLAVYMEDAISHYLWYKESNPKLKCAKFLREYFRSVKQGNHVLFREYRYVSATPYNRVCAFSIFWKTFRSLRDSSALTPMDYHSLMSLLFLDFSDVLVKAACRTTGRNEDRLEMKEFLYSFQLVFCLQDMVQLIRSVFDQLSDKGRISSVNLYHLLQNDWMASSSGSSSLWLPLAEIQAIISSEENWTSVEFLTRLSRHHLVVSLVGKLPDWSTFDTQVDFEFSRRVRSDRLVRPTTLYREFEPPGGSRRGEDSDSRRGRSQSALVLRT